MAQGKRRGRRSGSGRLYNLHLMAVGEYDIISLHVGSPCAYERHRVAMESVHNAVKYDERTSGREFSYGQHSELCQVHIRRIV